MRYSLAMVGAALVAVTLAGAAPMLVHGAAPRGQPAGAQPANLPLQTAHAFAPFLMAIVSRRTNQAENIFKLHRSVETMLEQPEPIRILGRFQKPAQLSLNLIGGRTLGQNLGILFFTVATEDGPVAFKIYYYSFNNEINISRMDLTDDWDEIERLSLTVDNLPSPITVGLAGEDIVPAGQ